MIQMLVHMRIFHDEQYMMIHLRNVEISGLFSGVSSARFTSAGGVRIHFLMPTRHMLTYEKCIERFKTRQNNYSFEG